LAAKGGERRRELWRKGVERRKREEENEEEREEGNGEERLGHCLTRSEM